jgi:hypothetical protein
MFKGGKPALARTNPERGQPPYEMPVTVLRFGAALSEGVSVAQRFLNGSRLGPGLTQPTERPHEQ